MIQDVAVRQHARGRMSGQQQSTDSEEAVQTVAGAHVSREEYGTFPGVLPLYGNTPFDIQEEAGS